MLVGGGTTLGRWEPANGLPLERAGEGSPLWTAVAELPLGAALQAKVGHWGRLGGARSCGAKEQASSGGRWRKQHGLAAGADALGARPLNLAVGCSGTGPCEPQGWAGTLRAAA